MRPPFPGMDPWLEHPAICLDVHNSLIPAIRDELVPRIAPKFEIDLLRAGEPMPLRKKTVRTDYRFLVSRGATRPRTKLFTFNVREPIPVIPIPLLPEDVEPDLDLGALVHALYNRARFDLRLNYSKPPVPPLSKPKMDWARAIVESGGLD
jgi:hypothetical protein